MERLSVLYRQISPLILCEHSEKTVAIKINRPKALNAFNYEILTSITILLQQNPQKTIIFSSTLPKSYCAGGDVSATVENDLMVPEFYRTELTTFYIASKIPRTIVIMQGFAIGAGNGLAMACKYRVSTNTTKFSMPENSIGLAPDTGASYFLTHLPNKAIGLYLMLTGATLSGNDCYWARITTHYVADDKIQALKDEIMKTGDIKASLDMFATVPHNNESKLLRNLPEIEEIFAPANSLETILQRLASKDTEFSKKVMEQICKNCPLSVKVSFKSFLLGLNKNYKQCMEQDYNIEVQLCFRRSYNYTTAITKRFIKKEKGEISWYPSALTQVTDEMVDVIIENPEGPKLVLGD